MATTKRPASLASTQQSKTSSTRPASSTSQPTPITQPAPVPIRSTQIAPMGSYKGYDYGPHHTDSAAKALVKLLKDRGLTPTGNWDADMNTLAAYNTYKESQKDDSGKKSTSTPTPIKEVIRRVDDYQPRPAPYVPVPRPWGKDSSLPARPTPTVRTRPDFDYESYAAKAGIGQTLAAQRAGIDPKANKIDQNYVQFRGGQKEFEKTIANWNKALKSGDDQQVYTQALNVMRYYKTEGGYDLQRAASSNISVVHGAMKFLWADELSLIHI